MTTPGSTTDDLRRVLSVVGSLGPAVDDADRVERLRLLQQVTSAAAAVQAQTGVDFAAAQRTAQAAAGVPVSRQGRGVAGQVGLALRISPWQAARWLGWATVLTAELPVTFAALRAGRTTSWRTMLVARETAMLSRADRGRVDAQVGPLLEGWGDSRVDREVRRRAYRCDPAAATARAAKATADRRVSIRPAPDTMVWLGALLPVTEGVAAYAALTRAADTTTAAGDSRGRGQIMADTLVERVTGQAHAADVAVEVQILLHEDTLAGAGPHRDEPAHLHGYGPVPAGWARTLIYDPRPADSPAVTSRVPAPPPRGDRSATATPPPGRWWRRVHTDRSGRVLTTDTHRRRFTAAQRTLVSVRDQTCRTPWCDAPLRHHDHVTDWHHGGPTATANAQGLCAACNHAKQAPGWLTRPLLGDAGRAVSITTPTGHTYRHRPPSPPGSSPPGARTPDSDVEHLLADVVWVA